MFAKGSSQDMNQLTHCPPCTRCAGGTETPKNNMTLEVETERWLRTGHCSLNQGLAFSVPVLSIDTNHILHGGLQTFNGHFCLFWKGKGSNCKVQKATQDTPKSSVRSRCDFHLFLWFSSADQPWNTHSTWKSQMPLSSQENLSIGNNTGAGERGLISRMLISWTNPVLILSSTVNCVPGVLALKRYRQEDQKFNVVFAYVMQSRPAQTSWDPVSKTTWHAAVELYSTISFTT